MIQPNKYSRVIQSCVDNSVVLVDVYSVLLAFGVTCPATSHSIKKLLMPGQRGAKTAKEDLQEAIQSIERAIQLLPKEATP